MPTWLYITALVAIFTLATALDWWRERRRRRKAMELLDFDRVLREMTKGDADATDAG